MKKIVDLNKPRTGIIVKERPSGSIVVKWHYDPFGERTITAKEMKELSNYDRRCSRYKIVNLDEHYMKAIRKRQRLSKEL